MPSYTDVQTRIFSYQSFKVYTWDISRQEAEPLIKKCLETSSCRYEFLPENNNECERFLITREIQHRGGELDPELISEGKEKLETLQHEIQIALDKYLAWRMYRKIYENANKEPAGSDAE